MYHRNVLFQIFTRKFQQSFNYTGTKNTYFRKGLLSLFAEIASQGNPPDQVRDRKFIHVSALYDNFEESQREYLTSCGSVDNANEQLEYFFLVRSIVCVVIPGIVIIVCSTAVIITRFRSLRQHRAARGDQNSEDPTQNTQVTLACRAPVTSIGVAKLDYH